MNILVFDTETTSLDKPFCYNVGYVIACADTKEVLAKRSYVVEQVWHNPMLFTTAYYANKRDIYVREMRARKTIMDKFGYICQQMIRDIASYEISHAYAFNSSFDDKVFNFNCDWFKCNNPFDNVEIHDIRAYAIKCLFDDDYKAFCEEHEYFTETGNYSSTAEIMFRYLTDNTDFIEDHTALSDSLIETEILFACNCDITEQLTAPKSLPRKIKKTFRIKKDKQVIFETECTDIIFSKKNNEIRLK